MTDRIPLDAGSSRPAMGGEIASDELVALAERYERTAAMPLGEYDDYGRGAAYVYALAAEEIRAALLARLDAEPRVRKLEEIRGQLVLLHSLANDTTEANWRDKRLYVLQTCIRMSDALSALEPSHD